jgi:hypothetical protein
MPDDGVKLKMAGGPDDETATDVHLPAVPAL